MLFARNKPLLGVLAVAAMTLGGSAIGLAQNQGDGQRPRQRNQQQDGQRQGRNQQQDGQRPGPGRNQRQAPIMELTRLVQAAGQLNLTEEQKGQLETLREEVREKVAELREELRDVSPQDARARVQEAVGDVRDRLNAILTPEQQAELRKAMDAAASQPAEGRGQGPGGGRGMMLDRLKQNLGQLDLTDEQKAKTDQIVADAEKEVAKLREQNQDPQATRQAAMALMRDTQQKLQAVLTPEQQEKLRELQPRRNRDAPEGGPPPGGPADAPRTQLDPAPAKAGSASSVAARAATSSSAAGGIVVIGQPVPTFSLKTLDRKTLTLQGLRGRPTAMVFGSYSLPLFRDKAAGYEKLRQQYRGRANVVFVYTREAHAAGEWDVQRNIDAEINLVQPVSLEERIELAKTARDQLKLGGDVLIDDIDDALAITHDAEQGGVTIFDSAGIVVARQPWPEPYATKTVLDELLKR